MEHVTMLFKGRAGFIGSHLPSRFFPNKKVLEWDGVNSNTVRPKKFALKNNNI